MAYAILRIQKLHAKEIKLADEHARRLRETLNADLSRPHLTILGNPDADLEVLIQERIAKENARKHTPKKTPIRSNAVMAVEFVLTASPEYFRPIDKSEYGYWDNEPLATFKTTSCGWLLEKYGDRIVRAQLHLDEATPHIHAYLVPIDDSGNLNCRGLFGTRSLLSKLQDSFASAMKPLGLERGIKGSKATHTQIKKYYTAVNQSLNLQLDAQGIEHVLADRERIVKQNREYQRTAKALSKQLEIKDKQIVQLQTEVEAKMQQLQYWQDKDQKRQKHIKSMNTQFMLAVAIKLGMRPIDAQGQLWQMDKTVFKFTNTGFSMPSSGVTRESDNPLEIIMIVNECSFLDAVNYSYENFGLELTRQAISNTPETIKQNSTNANHLPARVVLVDTTRDASAIATLENYPAKTTYLALSGSEPLEPPYEFLRLMPKDSVFIALNKNSDSEKLAHQIRQALPKQTVFMRPNSIDWITELAKANKQRQEQSVIDTQQDVQQQSQVNLNQGLTR